MFALCIAWVSHVQAQTTDPPPRGADGKVDFQGVWSTAWATALERPPGTSGLVITQDEAQILIKSAFGVLDERDPLSPLESLDFGRAMTIRGEIRSSLIVDPENGRLPYTAAALKSRQPPPVPSFDGPEGRPASERCLGTANAAAPFMTLPAGNIKQIIQTKDYLVVLSETFARLRIIPLGDAAPGRADQGRGRWDGDAIVVETRGFQPDDRVRATQFVNFAISPNTVITERFERTRPDEILYSYTVSDPDLYLRPWRAEMAFAKSPQRLYEWGCQEGNYALTNMLRAARLEESEATRRSSSNNRK